MSTSDARRPVELDGVPAEEDMSAADAASRLDQDPSKVPNRAEVPDDGSADTSNAQD